MPRHITRRHLVSTALLAGLAAVGAGVPGIAQASGYPSLFGTREARSDNIAMFPKWRGTLERYFEEADLAKDCIPGQISQCLLNDWQTFLDGQKGLDPKAQLSAVNAQMNSHRYILDPPNWGVPDYWATPLQFMEKNGDCEDYAIAKFMSLRALGWPNEAMRIVVLKDLNLRLMHAVLVVYHQSRAYVLDNQIDQVMPAEKIRHYRPVYSVNEESWWLHRS
ncbi:transglutaminase-like cysteine peptidase [Algihabitans albus]|uniref:transglutaminase-like cysteine peptidase n=1 Tax=Algihabitans albus TaxID=2164067 RepID=UPI0013C32F6A|nr:transglutaminase-like cysteine peptidase [Algihabitans albus]